MDSQEDPEARIRELESSLKDGTAPSELTQSSSEMSSGSYGYGEAPDSSGPPMSYVPSAPYGPPASFGQPGPYGQTPYFGPPPPGSGQPFPTVARTPSGGVGRGWLVIGVMTVVIVGIIGGAAVFASNLFSGVSPLVDPSSGPTTVSGGGGPFGTAPPGTGGRSQPPTVELPTVLAPTVEPTAPGPLPGGTYSVSGVGADKTFACNDGIISISGVSNTVTVTGHCASVSVSGVENRVVLEEADTISASGFTNRVTYRTGSPDIQKSGDGNTVEQG